MPVVRILVCLAQRRQTLSRRPLDQIRAALEKPFLIRLFPRLLLLRLLELEPDVFLPLADREGSVWVGEVFGAIEGVAAGGFDEETLAGFG